MRWVYSNPLFVGVAGVIYAQPPWLKALDSRAWPPARPVVTKQRCTLGTLLARQTRSPLQQAACARREEPLILQALSISIAHGLARAQAAARRHPRRIAAAVLTVLGGFAVTAFGIAPLAPDAADLPKRLVVEALPVAGLEAQLDALALHPLQLDRHGLSRATDTADTLLRRLGVVDPLAASFLRRDRDARRLVDGQGNKMVQVRTDADGNLLQLVARFPALDSQRMRSHFTRLTLTRTDTGFSSMLETAPLLPQTRLGSGSIRTSLWAAADDAQLPDAIASQLIEIFSGDVDFHRELRRGDTFSVAFEALTADDQPITWNEGTGRILAAEFVNHGRKLQAVWFQDDSRAKGAYFAPDGKSRQRAFLASPLAFSRITSGFAERFHPILQNWRAHNGVDYSAPTGTPVRAVGDGVVTLAGRQNGYGNVVQLQHASGRSTLYAHLSRIDVREGQRIEQGQSLGAVGATGWATGPHLHFEFRVNGQFQDPLLIARASEAMHIDGAMRPAFEALAAQAQRHLAAAESMAGYRGNAE
jgi:murein DD-endopeptidase MepM/ murein hydrolase activator NlpD